MTPIHVNVDQDGIFSAELFDGTYKLDFPIGQGPFMANAINTKDNSDTLILNVNGNTVQDIEVVPYYMIRNSEFSVIQDSTISATCSLEKIITDANAKDVENITLYVNKTYFVDNNNNVTTASIDGSEITSMDDINLKAVVPYLIPSQKYVFARIGLKIKNVEDRIFSSVVKLEIK